MINEKETKFEELANKCLKLVKNKLYFSYKSLSPAIYRMPIEYVQPGSGMFGTDANRIYADPMNVIMRYKQSPDAFVRTYLHMLFHCIYLHPFVTKYGVDTGVWNIALDICAEAAVLRMEPKEIDGDSHREQIISIIKQNIKMFIPELVYNELMKNSDNYDFEELVVLFHMDDHIWLEGDKGKSGNSDDNDDDDNNYQNPNQQPQNNDQNDDEQNSQDENQNGNGNNKDKNEDDSDDNDQNNDGNGNGNDNDNSNSKNNGKNKKNNGNGNNQKNNNKTKSQSQSSQKKQEWSDVSRQIATDMQSFHQQGKNSGDTVQEIEFLTQDKMEYDEFLRQFSIIEEKMMVNQDEFDYMYYTYGLTGMKRPDGSCATDKSVLLIEPLEYKEEKVIKDFVIAIDTSGSCSGDLVKKFLNKTYSILKETESFSSRVNIHIVQCDAKVQHDTKITNIDEMEYFMQHMKLYGFGGTDFRPVFTYVDELIAKKEFENLCGLIYFTDGYGTYPTKPTPYKTAFAFLEDYNNRDNIPAWAMSVYWKEDN